LTWVETPSETFVARHDAKDADDAVQVLEQLEGARAHLEGLLPARVGPLDVVLHGSRVQLVLAEPWLPVLRARTAPAGRRYQVGWCSERELHVLAPRLLAKRASNVEGSLELLMLAPTALLARRVVAAHHEGLPPPFGPRTFRRWTQWAWLVEGAAQWLSGQARHLRPAVTRRLREGRAPDFPPSVRDAPLLGGTIFDLLEREEGEKACVALAARPHPEGAQAALEEAFHGRALRHTEDAWRHHLERIASAEVSTTAPQRRRRGSKPRAR
jgi:hypothetical protein